MCFVFWLKKQELSAAACIGKTQNLKTIGATFKVEAMRSVNMPRKI
jgi:hypothetical protein